MARINHLGVVGRFPGIDDDLSELVHVGCNVTAHVKHLSFGMLHQGAYGNRVCNVVDVAEFARLRAVAKDREMLPGLLDT